MSNRKKNAKLEAAIVADPSITITGGTIKDDFCNYTYEVTDGKSRSFNHKVTGKGIIDDDMRTAYSKLNVHLAVIDDVYKHAGMEIIDINTMHNDELALLYNVTGFKIKGGDEDGSIIMTGNKYLSGGNRMELESPKIPMDNLSSYKWFKELKQAADECMQEVALYHAGKFTAVEAIEEEDSNVKQTRIGNDLEDDFEGGRV